MAFFLAGSPITAEADLLNPNSQQVNYVAWDPSNQAIVYAEQLGSFNVSTDLIDGQSPAAGEVAGNVSVIEGQHEDYHFRMWTIPNELRLNNPLIDTPIPFRLWNTFPTPQTLTAINVNGSSVLSFDLTPGVSALHDNEYREVNLQIGAGEPNIDALILFDFPSGDALLTLVATVSETFNLVPDVPVREEWEWLTDIMKSHDGSEQRISLRRHPRRNMTFDVDIIDLQDRQEQYELLFKNMTAQAVIPAYHHATNITQTTPIGGTRYFFDPALTQMREGEFLVAINPKTESATVARVDTLFADGAEVSSAAGEEITPAYYVYPAHSMILRNGSGMVMSQVTGKLNLRAEGFSTPTLVRPGSVSTVQLFDGYPVMDKRPLTDADERFTNRRDVLDFEVGIKDIARLGDPHPTISGTRRWSVNRYDAKLASEDYFRQFLDDVRGAQKAFLMPTWFPDLTLKEGFQAQPETGTIEINEVNYGSLLFPFDTWKRIQIEYEEGEPTYHTVTAANAVDDDTAVVTFTPALENDPRVQNIKNISFLLKCYGSDKVRRNHFARETIYSWAINTTDYG